MNTMLGCARALACAIGAAMALAACGGGGGDSGGSPPVQAANTTITGTVQRATLSGAQVEIYAVAPNGTKSFLARAASGTDGSFQIRAPFNDGDVLMLLASGGGYTDEATGTPRTLTAPLRAVVTRRSASQRVNISPYTEVATRMLEASASPSWTAADVARANKAVADWVGIPDLVDYRALDLKAAAPPPDLSNGEFAAALAAGAFSPFARRVDPSPASSMSSALDGLYRLIAIDEDDDRYVPQMLGALAEFADLAQLPDEARRVLKATALLGDANAPFSSATLDGYLPKGMSSGGATAPMPAQGLRMVGNPLAKLSFNRRGALVAYTGGSTADSWIRSFTSSVGEVYGDGEIGIGRWNGGGMMVDKAIPVLSLAAGYAALPEPGLHYAAALPPATLPACGLRKMSLTATTQPSLTQPTLVGNSGRTAFTGLTPDSQVSVQYLGGAAYLGADIGLIRPDGTVERFRNPGGLDAPWTGLAISGTATASSEHGFASASNPDVYTRNALSLKVEIGGPDANKLVAVGQSSLQGVDAATVAVAFTSPTGTPDLRACYTEPSPAAPLASPPVDGNHYVSMAYGRSSLTMSVPESAVFAPSGALRGLPLKAVSFNGGVADLAGNAEASIGRVNAAFDSGTTTQVRSTPYAVARPGYAAPTGGTATYDLIAATGVTADLGDGSGQVIPGIVQRATLTATFGQYPLGTASPWYWSSELDLGGTISGMPFSSAERMPMGAGSGQADGRFAGADYDGAISASGEYAALRFRATVNNMHTVFGALLFKRRP